MEGVWAAVTGGPKMGVELEKRMIGKPYRETYAFAAKKLEAYRRSLLGEGASTPLRRVYMVGRYFIVVFWAAILLIPESR